jgi:hypothetical protein
MRDGLDDQMDQFKNKIILFNTSYKRNCSNNQYRQYHGLNYHYHRSGGWPKLLVMFTAGFTIKTSLTGL